ANVLTPVVRAGVSAEAVPDDAVPRDGKAPEVKSPGGEDGRASVQSGPFLHANTISPAAAAPIGTHPRSYPLPLPPEARPSGPDQLLQHLPPPAAPRLERPLASVQSDDGAAGESVANPLPRVVIAVTLA